MTFDSTIVGYLQYRTPEKLDAAKRCLRAGEWIDVKDQWQPDRVCLHSTLGEEPTIDDGRRLLVIPPGEYRDLGRISTDLFPGATRGKVVIASADQCFDGWIEQPRPSAASMEIGDSAPVSDIDCIPLESYASARGLGRQSVTSPQYPEWQQRVITAFHSEHAPDVAELLGHIH